MKRITLSGGIFTVEAFAIYMGKAEIRQFIRKIDKFTWPERIYYSESEWDKPRTGKRGLRL